MSTKQAQEMLVLVGLFGIGLMLLHRPQPVQAQEGPTFTPSPAGPQVVAYLDEGANLRSGPGTEYDLIGLLVKGQNAPILGVIQIGPYTWFKIVYIGGPDNTAWVYQGNVQVRGDIPAIPTILPPPTPTLRSAGTLAVDVTPNTPTPDPRATRLPTFTPPALIVRPTLLPAQGARPSSGIPPALIMISLFVLGALGGLASFMQRR